MGVETTLSSMESDELLQKSAGGEGPSSPSPVIMSNCACVCMCAKEADP